MTFIINKLEYVKLNTIREMIWFCFFAVTRDGFML